MNGRQLHLALGLTMVISKTGITCSTAEGIRRIFKTSSSRCTLCLKMDLVDEKLGRYAHRMSDPRLTVLLGEENPLWHTVSLDLIETLHWNSSEDQEASTALTNVGGSSSLTWHLDYQRFSWWMEVPGRMSQEPRAKSQDTSQDCCWRWSSTQSFSN